MSTANTTSRRALPVPSARAGLRRLSSITASGAEIHNGPITIGSNYRSSNAHETAIALELAKRHMELSGSGIATPSTPPESDTTDAYAFAFDIDGVLIKGGTVIPQAIEAMKVLNGENEYGLKVFVIFLLQYCIL